LARELYSLYKQKHATTLLCELDSVLIRGLIVYSFLFLFQIEALILWRVLLARKLHSLDTQKHSTTLEVTRYASRVRVRVRVRGSGWG